MKYIALLSLALLLAAQPVVAATLLTDEKTVALTEPSSSDVYAAAQNISLEESVAGDVFAAGEQVQVRGTVSEDVVLAGNDVQLRGAVEDDALLAGSTVSVANTIAGDLFAAGQKVTLDRATSVGGDTYLAGNNVIIAGTHAGTVRVAGAAVTIRSGTVINGDLISHGQTEPTIEDGATITGSIRHKQFDAPRQGTTQQLAGWVRSVLTWFVLAALALYLLPALTARALRTSTEASGRSLLVGIGWVILLIPASIFFAITVIGLPLTFGLILLTLLLGIAAGAYAAIITGEFVMRRVLKITAPLSWQHALLGAVVLGALQLVPIIGPLLMLAVLLVTFGALVVSVWQLLRNTPSPLPTA